MSFVLIALSCFVSCTCLWSTDNQEISLTDSVSNAAPIHQALQHVFTYSTMPSLNSFCTMLDSIAQDMGCANNVHSIVYRILQDAHTEHQSDTLLDLAETLLHLSELHTNASYQEPITFSRPIAPTKSAIHDASVFLRLLHTQQLISTQPYQGRHRLFQAVYNQLIANYSPDALVNFSIIAIAQLSFYKHTPHADWLINLYASASSKLRLHILQSQVTATEASPLNQADLYTTCMLTLSDTLLQIYNRPQSLSVSVGDILNVVPYHLILPYTIHALTPHARLANILHEAQTMPLKNQSAVVASTEVLVDTAFLLNLQLEGWALCYSTICQFFTYAPNTQRTLEEVAFLRLMQVRTTGAILLNHMNSPKRTIAQYIPEFLHTSSPHITETLKSFASTQNPNIRELSETNIFHYSLCMSRALSLQDSCEQTDLCVANICDQSVRHLASCITKHYLNQPQTEILPDPFCGKVSKINLMTLATYLGTIPQKTHCVTRWVNAIFSHTIIQSMPPQSIREARRRVERVHLPNISLRLACAYIFQDVITPSTDKIPAEVTDKNIANFASLRLPDLPESCEQTIKLLLQHLALGHIILSESEKEICATEVRNILLRATDKQIRENIEGTAYTASVPVVLPFLYVRSTGDSDFELFQGIADHHPQVQNALYTYWVWRVYSKDLDYIKEPLLAFSSTQIYGKSYSFSKFFALKSLSNGELRLSVPIIHGAPSSTLNTLLKLYQISQSIQIYHPNMAESMRNNLCILGQCPAFFQALDKAQTTADLQSVFESYHRTQDLLVISAPKMGNLFEQIQGYLSSKDTALSQSEHALIHTFSLVAITHHLNQTQSPFYPEAIHQLRQMLSAPLRTNRTNSCVQNLLNLFFGDSNHLTQQTILTSQSQLDAFMYADSNDLSEECSLQPTTSAQTGFSWAQPNHLSAPAENTECLWDRTPLPADVVNLFCETTAQEASTPFPEPLSEEEMRTLTHEQSALEILQLRAYLENVSSTTTEKETCIFTNEQSELDSLNLNAYLEVFSSTRFDDIT